jgi:ketosteroid isomerase-like protein
MIQIARRYALSLALVIAACAPAAPAGLSDAVRSQLKAIIDDFTKRLMAKDWAGLAGLYSTDAILMPPNEPAVKGRAAIQAWISAFPPISSFSLTADDVDGGGDVAYVRGTYQMSFTVPGTTTPVNDHGKYLEIHKRQADGSWLTTADTFNSDVPLVPAPAPAKSKK